MKMRVGILTSGGDCPGLNATIRGVAKALYQRMGDKVEIIGILNGYDGLINGNYREMSPDEFSGILTVGGTILVSLLLAAVVECCVSLLMRLLRRSAKVGTAGTAQA